MFIFPLAKMESEIREEIRESFIDEKKKETLDGKHLFNHPFEGTDISKQENSINFNMTYRLYKVRLLKGSDQRLNIVQFLKTWYLRVGKITGYTF
jgi:hypothetical protein